MPNIAEVPPMPSISTSTATALNPGERRIMRNPNFISCMKFITISVLEG